MGGTGRPAFARSAKVARLDALLCDDWFGGGVEQRDQFTRNEHDRARRTIEAVGHCTPRADTLAGVGVSGQLPGARQRTARVRRELRGARRSYPVGTERFGDRGLVERWEVDADTPAGDSDKVRRDLVGEDQEDGRRGRLLDRLE